MKHILVILLLCFGTLIGCEIPVSEVMTGLEELNEPRPPEIKLNAVNPGELTGIFYNFETNQQEIHYIPHDQVKEPPKILLFPRGPGEQNGFIHHVEVNEIHVHYVPHTLAVKEDIEEETEETED